MSLMSLCSVDGGWFPGHKGVSEDSIFPSVDIGLRVSSDYDLWQLHEKGSRLHEVEGIRRPLETFIGRRT